MDTCRKHPDTELNLSALGTPFCRICRRENALDVQAAVKRGGPAVELDEPTSASLRV